MPSPNTVLHAGSDPAGIHPQVVLFVLLLLAVGVALALYVLLGFFGPADDAAGEMATADEIATADGRRE